MVWEDLWITGLKAIEEFPEGKPLEQLVFLSNLTSQLLEKYPDKYTKRMEYIGSVLK